MEHGLIFFFYFVFFVFHAKAVQIMGKPKLVCGRHKFLSHTFATDVKMGTDDHVPFYPALLNSL